MSKERIAAFTDAVLAIIMTILVLELKKTTQVTLAGLWALKINFFAYALSFFWLGAMWLTHHNNWEKIKRVNNATAVATLLMLFFASFFPYTTSLVALNFNNKVAQAFYGIIILAVTFSNIGISRSIDRANQNVQLGLLYTISDRMVYLDILIKLVGLVLTLTIYPPMMMYAVFISMIVMLFAHQD